MRANRPRPKRPKKQLNLDSLLSTMEIKLYEKKTYCNKRYLNITYIGYFDDKSNCYCVNLFLLYFIVSNIFNLNFTVKSENEPVKIETSLMRISHKKRKDSCPFSLVE